MACAVIDIPFSGYMIRTYKFETIEEAKAFVKLNSEIQVAGAYARQTGGGYLAILDENYAPVLLYGIGLKGAWEKAD